MYDGREAASSTDFRKSTGISSSHKRIGGPAARAARKPSMLAKDGAILGVHPKVFSPTSVEFKSGINDAFPRKRHQKRLSLAKTRAVLSFTPLTMLQAVWSKNSNGFEMACLKISHRLPLRMDFSDPETAPTISLSRSYTLQGNQKSFGRVCWLWQPERGTKNSGGKRKFGGGEPHPERSDQGSAAAFGRRKGDTGRDRSPPGSKGTGGRGGSGQARHDSGLVSEAHRKQI